MNYSTARTYRLGILKRGNSRKYEEFKRIARQVWPESSEDLIVLVASLAWYRTAMFSSTARNLVYAFTRYADGTGMDKSDTDKEAAITDFMTRTKLETLNRWRDCLCQFGLLQPIKVEETE